tara:strand:- start:4 stop:522 length:519 start_codon:yes stop_codon:yes gene_type:complete
MPNWCINRLTVEHPEEDMIKKFDKAYREDWVIETFYPTPREPNDPTKLIGEDEAASSSGMPSWWQWRIKNWGTKWDIGCKADGGSYGMEPTIVGNELSVSFDSAWSPPLGFYERLVKLGFQVKASYFEPGMVFAGTWENGKEEYYEGSIEEFPSVLIDLYGMREYYSEGEEV